MKIKAMNIHLPDAKDAANALCGAFDWDNSPQGHAYWATVVANLRKIIKAKEGNEQ